MAEVHEVLRQDVSQLRADLAGLSRDQAALAEFQRRATRRNLGALALAMAVTAAAWLLGGSDWLRFYLLPLVAGLGLLFHLGGRLLARSADRRLTELQHLLVTATEALAARDFPPELQEETHNSLQPLPPAG